MTKKIISLILCLTMLSSVMSVGVTAVDTEYSDYSEYPVILVPGYSGSELDMVNADGTTERVWHFDMMNILTLVLNDIAEFSKGIIEYANGDPPLFTLKFENGLNQLLGNMRCNPDGSSVKNLKIVYDNAAVTNMGYIHENGLNDEVIGEVDLFEEISAVIGEENCFFFQSDWRMSVLDCAARLDSYIQMVKEFSGKDKVNIIAVSHGGQVTATYLSLYGYKQDVDNAVLTVPAIGGALLAYDIMNESVALDEYNLIYFLEHGFISEDDYKWLLQAEQLGFLDDLIAAILPPIKDFIRHFGSIWDFIPEEYYDELKAKELDPVENAGIIAKSDIVHYEIMPNMAENLQKCINEYGMNISIIAGYGVPAVTGAQEQSDAIIGVNDATGAYCAPYGQRFNDGYTGCGAVCSDTTHDHVSPSFEVDASAAYLPENTWYVEELFHGMTFNDKYSRALALKTLLTDDIIDIYSDPAYPQFYSSTNACNTVFAKFDKSPVGYVSDADNYLTVTNISEKYSVKITSVTFAGSEFIALSAGIKALAPGQSVSIPVSGKLPAVSRQNMQLQIDYYCEDRALTPMGTKTFNFMIMNGGPIEYNYENPLVSADYVIGIDGVIDEEATEKLEFFGLINFIEFFYNWIAAIMKEMGLTYLFNN